MPSIISHAVVGLAAASAVSAKTMPLRFWILSVLCPVLPDADTIAFRLGIPYSHFFGHRGFFHSLFFALTVAVSVSTIFFKEHALFTHNWFLLCGYFSLITATHGILDAFTNGGLGIALLSPFNGKRYFFPWTPINVSPIGIASFFSEWGKRVIISEIVWVWVPSVLIMIAIRIIRG